MIAIHTKSGQFAIEWIAYCREKDIPFKAVDCFAPEIISQLKGCRALLWHWPHHDFRAQLFARQLIASVEEMGITVFPSTKTSWHYDDKVGQKYLLEAMRAPLVPTYVFYEKEVALKWVNTATFPKVWKLRGGAGSQNVQLAKTQADARRIIKRSFSKGWGNSRFHALKERLWHLRRDRSLSAFLNLSRGVFRAIVPHELNSKNPLQRDYVYFQEFIPDNKFDIRVIVIGDRAFAIQRMVRTGDFKASGSGEIVFDRSVIPLDCVQIAFDVTSNLGSQSCAFDFVQRDGKWLIVEVSYTFSADAYRKCPGYWDRSLIWHEAPVTPERFMLEDLLTTIGIGTH
ncbi:ATP-grasp domain-containing protein [Celeribacter sp.]|uniref:ATP-grasp domain-containing protein n=1 Tax=Celeribacter sp. TaxID=1890673 RepID=UPI003A91B011